MLLTKKGEKLLDWNVSVSYVVIASIPNQTSLAGKILILNWYHSLRFSKHWRIEIYRPQLAGEIKF